MARARSSTGRASVSASSSSTGSSSGGSISRLSPGPAIAHPDHVNDPRDGGGKRSNGEGRRPRQTNSAFSSGAAHGTRNLLANRDIERCTIRGARCSRGRSCNGYRVPDEPHAAGGDFITTPVPWRRVNMTTEPRKASALLRAVCILSLALQAAVAQAQQPFKIYISADMEGIGGVVTDEQLGPPGFEYARFREFMTSEVNAAITAARAAGAGEILISDSHGNGQNLLIEKLPPDVQVVRSWPRPLMMMQGIDPS